MKLQGKAFMAVAQGSQSKEGQGIERFIGVGAFKVLAVNPDKETLSKIYGTDIENEPVYTSVNDEGIEQLRVDFIIKSDAEKNNGVEVITKASYFLRNSSIKGSNSGKIQVINKYGETTWLDSDHVKNGTVPDNMSWFEFPYRPAYAGEENLTKFIKAYLNIPNKSFRKKDGTVVELQNKSDAEARFDSIKNWFQGNVSELRQVIKFQPNNHVKLALGVRTTDDNKLYQDIFTEFPLKLGVSDYTKLSSEIQERKNAGAYANTEFNVKPLHTYEVNATDFSKDSGSEEVDSFFG